MEWLNLGVGFLVSATDGLRKFSSRRNYFRVSKTYGLLIECAFRKQYRL